LESATPLIEANPDNILHRKIDGRAINKVSLSNVRYIYDMRVIDRIQSPNSPGDGIENGLSSFLNWVEQLDADFSPRTSVKGTVDKATSSSTGEIADYVWADPLPGQTVWIFDDFS
jgi:hypothetical protein